MNDKCSAGTGRFLEVMANTMGLRPDDLCELARQGGGTKISSMCTVFAESEVVSLVAQNKEVADIVHGLNHSVAAKVSSLAKRVAPEEGYIMTGGVANNQGVVKALEETLGAKLFICEEAQLCGALGAALFALEQAAG
jgi:predicted CoA-substrate-specific enzyme activase